MEADATTCAQYAEDVRNLKAKKGDKVAIDAAVKSLLAAKVKNHLRFRSV